MIVNSIIGLNGEIIIPQDLRGRMNLHSGTQVFLEVIGDSLIITRSHTPITDLFRETAKMISYPEINSDLDYEEMMKERVG